MEKWNGTKKKLIKLNGVQQSALVCNLASRAAGCVDCKISISKFGILVLQGILRQRKRRPLR